MDVSRPENYSDAREAGVQGGGGDSASIKGDKKPMGNKKAKLEARIISCLTESAQGIKRLGEASIESNKLQKLHLDSMRETNVKKREYTDIKCVQEEEKHHLELLRMDISPHLKEVIMKNLERKVTEGLAADKTTTNQPSTKMDVTEPEKAQTSKIPSDYELHSEQQETQHEM
ncbi:hypothetical protein FGB62_2g47 [Gracilaria domingensis]|nr:hypothetical protein FGB62_2g47 [Gracilaria domingensis]